MRRGYDRVGVIHGGFDAWMRKQLPTQPRVEEVRLLAGESGSSTAGAPADPPAVAGNPSA